MMQMELSQISRLPLTDDRQLQYSNDLAFTYFREAIQGARG